VFTGIAFMGKSAEADSKNATRRDGISTFSVRFDATDPITS
jgi:hypothetical protein